MRKKSFKAESKRLLELMINSIYSHKEIFLRELISNASDAIDKLYYHSLKDGISGLSRDEFEINIAVDKEKGTLTISDNGIGMTAQELENNLGTIAQSGSLSFKKNTGEDEEANEDIDIIGQFGVGFYSAFMVASHIEVASRAYGSDEANLWKSDGVDGYTIEPCTMEGHGSIITLTLKEDSPEEEYSRFLDQYTIDSLVRKYSDYIRYPIKMEKTKNRPVEGGDGEFEEYTEVDTLNSMVPIWKRSKSELTDEDYNRFYKDKFLDFTDPLKTIHIATEGTATFNALLYIPSKAPYNYYSRDYEKGLKLYASGVLIMDMCKELIPDCFSFVKGLVDSQDLSLNISREILQHDRQLKLIASSVEKKIKAELKKMLENDRENYEKVYANFGLQFKYGIYSSYGQNKDLLSDLLLFKSSNGDGYTTFAEYCDRMREDQKYIYYACGETPERIARMPQIERLISKGYEVLYLTDDIDEFTFKVLGNWDDKEFRSASGDDLGIEDDEQNNAQQLEKDNADMLACIKETLGDKVTKVRPSVRLMSCPVCITADGMLSLEMERVLNSAPGADQKVKADRVLEINAEHPIFEKLRNLYESDKETLSKFANMLYNQALLIEDLPIDDPVAFAAQICELMVK